MGYRKVMLVDDDRLSVDYMEHLIDWETRGYEITGKAYNGKQALHQFQKNPPHILITDISMPLMDGIELIRQIKAIKPDTRTILLTAYSEFEYARAAVSAGVDFYIIKDEMTKEVLLEKLEAIEKTLGELQHISRILFQKALQDYFREGSEFVEEHYPDQEIEHFFQGKYPVVLIRRELTFWPEGMGIRQKEAGSIASTVEKILKELEGEAPFQYGLISEDTLSIFWGERPQGEAEAYQFFLYKCRDLKKALEEKGAGRYSFYFMHRPVSLPYLREFVKKQEKHGFFYGSEVCLMGECKEDRREPVLFSEKEVQKIMETGNEDNLFQKFRETLDLKGGSYGSFLENAGEWYRVLRREEKKRGWESGKLLEKRLLHDGKDIYLWLEEGIRKWLEYKQHPGYRQEVRQTIAYIQKHYGKESLAIEEMAACAGISSSRLSVLFKQDTGITVGQYVTQVRIKKAKELLEKETYKVYEVAEMVGYGTSQYFSRIFYKETGMYPGEYKRRG